MTAIYDFNWILNIIKSCNNDFHFDCVDTMITLFIAKHKEEALAAELTMQRIHKWNLIHSILS